MLQSVIFVHLNSTLEYEIERIMNVIKDLCLSNETLRFIPRKNLYFDIVKFFCDSEEIWGRTTFNFDNFEENLLHLKSIKLVNNDIVLCYDFSLTEELKSELQKGVCRDSVSEVQSIQELNLGSLNYPAPALLTAVHNILQLPWPCRLTNNLLRLYNPETETVLNFGTQIDGSRTFMRNLPSLQQEVQRYGDKRSKENQLKGRIFQMSLTNSSGRSLSDGDLGEPWIYQPPHQRIYQPPHQRKKIIPNTRGIFRQNSASNLSESDTSSIVSIPIKKKHGKKNQGPKKTSSKTKNVDSVGGEARGRGDNTIQEPDVRRGDTTVQSNRAGDNITVADVHETEVCSRESSDTVDDMGFGLFDSPARTRKMPPPPPQPTTTIEPPGPTPAQPRVLGLDDLVEDLAGETSRIEVNDELTEEIAGDIVNHITNIIEGDKN